MTARTVDDLLLKFGDPGRFQVGVYCMLWIAMCTLAFNNFLSLFLVSYYPHHCKLPDDWSWQLNQSIPRTESGELDSCSMYRNPDDISQGTTKCIYGWEHRPPGDKWTIVQEFDLVCDRQYLGPLATSLYFLGVMVGSLIFGFSSDKFGRRPTILVTIYSQIAVSVVMSFSNSYGMFVSLRALHGVLLQGCYSSAFTMSVEFFQPHRRNVVAVASQCLWPFMLCVTTLFSYFFGNWRTLHIIAGLPGLVTIFYIWVLPESIRWLLVSERLMRAEKEIRRIAKYNSILVPANLTNNIKLVAHTVLSNQTIPSNREYGVKDLFKGNKMKLVLFGSWFNWWATMVMYWGVSYTMPMMGSSVHVNFLISGSLEVVFSIAMFWVMQKVGRRKMCMSFMCVSALLCLTTALMRSVLPSDVSWAQILLALLASLGRTILGLFYCVFPMYTSELFPTTVRNLGTGLTSFFARSGSLIAPYFVLMEQNVWRPLPFLIYAALAIGTMGVLFVLPETLNKPLPEVPEEVGKLWRKSFETTVHNRVERSSVRSLGNNDVIRNTTNGVHRDKFPEHSAAEVVSLKASDGRRGGV